MKNNKKYKPECRDLDELTGWLDEKGFNQSEAIEFINDMLPKELRKKVIEAVERGYNETIGSMGECEEMDEKV